MEKVIQTAKKFIERGFDPHETIRLLKATNFPGFLSWGVNKATVIGNEDGGNGLLFLVNGHHHKGWVLITLNFLDYYEVRLIDNEGVVKDTETDIFCDNLFDVIDEKIERIPEYNR